MTHTHHMVIINTIRNQIPQGTLGNGFSAVFKTYYASKTSSKTSVLAVTHLRFQVTIKNEARLPSYLRKHRRCYRFTYHLVSACKADYDQLYTVTFSNGRGLCSTFILALVFAACSSGDIRQAVSTTKAIPARITVKNLCRLVTVVCTSIHTQKPNIYLIIVNINK